MRGQERPELRPAKIAEVLGSNSHPVTDEALGDGVSYSLRGGVRLELYMKKGFTRLSAPNLAVVLGQIQDIDNIEDRHLFLAARSNRGLAYIIVDADGNFDVTNHVYSPQLEGTKEV